MQKLKQIYRWILGDQGLLVEIANAFAIFTVFSSAMMVWGYDTPKEGKFAYVHLLLRLAIITLVCAVWDFESTRADMRRYAAYLRRPWRPSLRQFSHYAAREWFDAVCVIYTLVIILACLVVILVVPAPTGGQEFYVALLWLYGLIWVALFAWLVVEKLKGKGNGRA